MPWSTPLDDPDRTVGRRCNRAPSKFTKQATDEIRNRAPYADPERAARKVCGDRAEGQKMNRLRFMHRLPAMAALLLIVIVGATDIAGATDDPASDIRAALEQWRLDFNARQSAHICDLFSPTLRYDFRGLPEQNHTLLCDRLHRALADRSKTFQYDLRIREIIVSDSLAVVRLTWVSTVTSPDRKSTTTDEPGLDIFERQANGHWKIIRYLAYEDEQSGRAQ